jgi:solute carrier family 25 iron transporter 28/37
MEIDEEATKSTVNFISGAIAGTAEHCGMYPIDTIKTHLQANKNSKIIKTTLDIWKKEGLRGYFRGITAVFWGAAPAHAVYFSVYELLKNHLINRFMIHEHLAFSIAGVIATLMSDAIFCPTDAIKQRRQLNVKEYSGTFHAAKVIIKNEGIKALYAGYTTTVIMNIPYGAIYFPMYEYSKKKLNKRFSNNNQEYISFVHTFAGGFAGIIASGITNPLDVAKTKLQTQGDLGVKYRGLLDAMYKIWLEDGVRGYLRGIGPRMMFNSLSAGICWTTYEYMKYFLTKNTNL